MNDMFSSPQSFNQDIGDWDVRNVTEMAGMFNTVATFDQDIRGWDVRSVTRRQQFAPNTLPVDNR